MFSSAASSSKALSEWPSGAIFKLTRNRPQFDAEDSSYRRRIKNGLSSCNRLHLRISNDVRLLQAHLQHLDFGLQPGNLEIVEPRAIQPFRRGTEWNDDARIADGALPAAAGTGIGVGIEVAAGDAEIEVAA